MNGPVLVIANHLGDADVILKVAFLPRQIEAIAKIELFDLPILGRIMEAYGVIWIRRGQPDRQALRAALQGLSESRMVMIAPEGRESLTGALEEATRGAAFLAVRSNALVLPVAITGTQNKRLLANLRQLRKTPVTLTIGQPFQVTEASPTHEPTSISRQELIEQATHQMMQRIAVLLPDEYKGVYQEG
jgi:1-acyl-sn-glycerol-3-phosphate acyltransferase